MDQFQKARRINQIKAENVAAKVRANNTVPHMTDRQLWREVTKALDDSEHLRRMLGHVDKIADVVIARAAVDELRLRGVQQQLPI